MKTGENVAIGKKTRSHKTSELYLFPIFRKLKMFEFICTYKYMLLVTINILMWKKGLEHSLFVCYSYKDFTAVDKFSRGLIFVWINFR